MSFEIEEFTEYEGMIHEHVTRYRIVGRTFGYQPFTAGPFQTWEEAQQVLNVISTQELVRSLKNSSAGW